MQNPQPALKHAPENGVCAVIVTYNIGKKVLDGIASLMPQVQHIVVVDNSSSDNSYHVVRDYAAQHEGHLTVLCNLTNNLAKAQNMGIAEAKKRGFAWVLLLDHDSVAESGMVQTLLTYYHQLHHQEAPIAVIVPNIHDRFSARRASYLTHYKGVLPWRRHFTDQPILYDILVAIASGSLIPMSVLEDVGGMDEDFCIDQVDFEWCLRAVSRGYHIVAVHDAVLNHQLGRCRDFTWQKLCITTSNHNAIRRYFIYRNRLRLWRRYGLKLPAFLLFDICAVAYDIAKILFLEAHKKQKFQAIWQGVRDACLGRQSRNLHQPSAHVLPPYLSTQVV